MSTIIKEGKAEIVFPEGNQVFYNPIQEFNRDMSIACINVWSETFTQKNETKTKEKKETTATTQETTQEITQETTKEITKETTATTQETTAETTQETVKDIVRKRFTLFEGLAATGLRSLRYALELTHPPLITANDFDPTATASLSENIIHNNLAHLITPSTGDCNQVLWNTLGAGKKFDCIDLDPYGSSANFLEASIRAISDNGLLLVTCTDMAVLAGSQSDACYSRYGGLPLHNTTFCHEMGLRMIIGLVARIAARCDKAVDCLMSCSIDFYARVFLKIRTNASESKLLSLNTGTIYYCQGCKSYTTQPVGNATINGKSKKFYPSRLHINKQCGVCNGAITIGGPFWNAPIHNKEFVTKVIEHVTLNQDAFNTKTRMIGMMTVINEELDTPFFYSIPQLCSIAQCSAMKNKVFVSGLLNAGFRVSGTHCRPEGIKTDASYEVVWDLMRGWCKSQEVVGKEGSVGKYILDKPATVVIDFTLHKDAEPESKKVNLVRFQENPLPNWGPKSKAGKRVQGEKQGQTKKQKMLLQDKPVILK